MYRRQSTENDFFKTSFEEKLQKYDCIVNGVCPTLQYLYVCSWLDDRILFSTRSPVPVEPNLLNRQRLFFFTHTHTHTHPNEHRSLCDRKRCISDYGVARDAVGFESVSTNNDDGHIFSKWLPKNVGRLVGVIIIITWSANGWPRPTWYVL